MNIFKSCKKSITYLVILSMVVAGVVPTSFVKAEEENTSKNTTEDSLIYKNIKGQCGPQTYFQLEKDGTLRITGTGEIDIEQFDDLQKAEISDKVLKVVMDNEITNIPDGMFKNYKNIKEVELSNGLEIIGKNAFANCESLKEIVLLKHISKVSDYAFFNCTGLESVYIFLSSNANPNGHYDKIPCGTIEENAFYGCNNMKDVTTGYAVNFPKSWPDSVEKMRLNYGLTGYAEEHGITIIRFSYEGYNTWPDGGKNVVGYTDGFYFVGNKGVVIKKDILPELGCKTVIIGNGVEGIETSGMSYKRELEYVYLPESIKYIENYAFQYDAKLKEITIPSKVPKIENHTFDNCPELTTMTIKNPNIELAKKGMPMNLKTIYGFRNSTAQQYAEENGIEFISIDIDKEEETTTTESTTQATTITTTSQITTPELITDSITSETTAGSTTVPKISETVTDPKVETTENTTETEETTMNSTTVNVTSADVSTTTEESKTNESFSEESISDLTTDKIFSTTIITEKQSFEVVTSGETGRKEKLSLSRVKEKNYHTVRLIWKKINTSKDYEIYRAEKKSGKYISVKKLKSGVYSDSKVKAGKKYFYKIKTTSNDGKVIWSGTKEIYVKGTPNRPKLSIKKTKSKWTLTWGIIGDNSKGLQVYMKTSKKGKFVKVNEVNKLKKKRNKKGITGMSGSRSSLDKKVTYFFKVRTYAVVNGKKVYSRWSKVKKMKG
ncbi:leucine-rich repeat domain-containing protein [Eubacterium sp.]|uniref:leucine-rich repeat domain-containing protein n=1 Tax=Eubacterium sp. TaxID=142586 RepID=UPI00261D0C46|nr:leucine-rich repeat domain-containing protein [uncultured Eubacterium sp.]